MERFSECIGTFGLGISEIFEFRSIGNRGISSRNLGVSVRHLESWNILELFWQSWNFRPFGVSSSSQQRIWYKFESYPYQKTTPDAGDGWARISFPNSKVRRQIFFEILFAFSYVMQTRFQRRFTILFGI
jgi:hypothetical protein